MPRIALIGGPEIASYTVADELWRLINKHTKTAFTFSVISLVNEEAAIAFFEYFVQQEDFLGFNVALPYKQLFAKLVRKKANGQIEQDIVNTVYKFKGNILGANTDPLGIVSALENRTDITSIKSCLMLGAGGAGRATAEHLSKHFGIVVALHDPFVLGTDLELMSDRTYDLVINATPLGKVPLNEAAKHSASPLNTMELQRISHGGTVVQEMNYFPEATQLLNIGHSLGLYTVSGKEMLTYQALESWSRYFGLAYSQQAATDILDAMTNYLNQKDQLMQGRSTNE